jgi:biopolymer transport protein ExbD/biopolymer transport protein TolR
MDATAFAGVMLALLFLMMPWVAVHPHGGGFVDLPVTEHSRRVPGALREDAVIIAVTRDGGVFFRGARVLLEDLPEMIRVGLQGEAEKRIYVKADARAKYAGVQKVLREIAKSGVEDVSFLTEKW